MPSPPKTRQCTVLSPASKGLEQKLPKIHSTSTFKHKGMSIEGIVIDRFPKKGEVLVGFKTQDGSLSDEAYKLKSKQFYENVSF